MPVSNEVANCKAMLDALYLCVSPVYQFSELHMYGKYSSCVDERHNLKVCARAKVKSSDEEAREVLKELRDLRWSKDMRLRENSPTNGVIWELKKEGETGWGDVKKEG
eukprot:CAMPEP_0182453260 /NCGR_PEP_ID=MMETSP1319-20130603/397_1 /TAXON_ID=172717 /ORGANISM="Bolidomonas pacifica, Strain RCC208" /LENGTH=107 /DNA_ID=CAMNT_0024651171 /DNA_START=185 /DNA_END=508 /DNA_ORIENTATION=+